MGRTERTTRADGEVILCGGAINSPHLLLRGVGVDVVVDRPGVGENLQDHSNVPTFSVAD